MVWRVQSESSIVASDNPRHLADSDVDVYGESADWALTDSGQGLHGRPPKADQ